MGLVSNLSCCRMLFLLLIDRCSIGLRPFTFGNLILLPSPAMWQGLLNLYSGGPFFGGILKPFKLCM